MFKSILVATDGSDHATKAVELAGDLAGKYQARLLLLNVTASSMDADTVRQVVDVRRMSAEAREELERIEEVQKTAQRLAETSRYPLPLTPTVQQALGEVILEVAEDGAKDHGALTIAKEVIHGDPAASILDAAERHAADLIVMGSRGLSNLEGIFIGSVSHKVSHLAKCTCITVK